MQNFSEFKRRNHSLTYVDSNQSFGPNKPKLKAGAGKKRSKAKLSIMRQEDD